MATYTPAQLIPVTSLDSTTIAAAKYSAPASTTGIIRTIQVMPQATANFTLSLGAAAAGTRIFQSVAVSASVPSVYNGWWVTAPNSADAINVHCNVTSANSVLGSVGGYSYA